MVGVFCLFGVSFFFSCFCLLWALLNYCCWFFFFSLGLCLELWVGWFGLFFVGVLGGLVFVVGLSVSGFCVCCFFFFFMLFGSCF